MNGNHMKLAIVIIGVMLLGSTITSMFLYEDSEGTRSSDDGHEASEWGIGSQPITHTDQEFPFEPSTDGSEGQHDGGISYSLTRTYADGRSAAFEPEPSGSHAGDTRSDPGSHPLSLPITELVDLEEIAIGNLRNTNVGTLWVFDDTHQNVKEIHTGEFESNALGGSDMASGDFDGDGLKELVISSQLESVQNETSTKVTLVSFFDDETTNFELLNTSVYWLTSCALTVGDFDGDGLDEVAMVGNYQHNVSMGGVVLDDLDSSNQVIHIWDPIDHGWEVEPKPTAHHDITAGDFDGDGRDDIATVGYYNDTLISWIWSLNDQPDEQFPLYDGMSLITTLPEMLFTMGQPSLATGEIDGDGRDELIVTTHDSDWNLHYWIYDDQLTNFETLRDVRETIRIRSTESTTGDVDGDGLDEIFLVGHEVAHLVGRVLDDANHDFAELKNIDRVFEDPWFYWFNVRVETGDVDGDGYEEYAILGQSYIFLYGELHDDLGPGNGELLEIWKIGDNKHPTLAIGDFDGDGLILEYTGEQTSFQTPDIPIAALAAPPVIDGVNQHPEGSFTRLGITEPLGYDGAYQLDISTELSFSFEGDPIEMPVGVLDAFLEEFTITQTPVKITGSNISFEGTYPDDHVLYQSSEFDQYTYTIVSWPGHDDRIGETVSINVPTNITIGTATLAEFNAAAGSAQSIGPETFDHQSGDINTYPTSDERNTTLNSYPGWSSEAIPVGIGTGLANVAIDLGEFEIDVGSLRYGTPWGHLDGTLEGFNSTMGLTSKWISEVTIGENMILEGSVGELPADGKPGTSVYSYGMFVYTHDPSEDMPVFLVINYWVEGIIDPAQGDDDPYGYWPFDTIVDPNMTEDHTSHQNDAEVKGATLTDGVKDKALSFDGINDEVEIPLDLPSTNMTIELWFNTSETDTGIFSIPGDPKYINMPDFDFQLKNGSPRIQVTGEEDLTADSLLSDGLWHHWVWTFEDDVGQKLYIDGEHVGEQSHDGSETILEDQIIIGYSSASAQSHFEGSIDEVTIYLRVLNASEVDGKFTAMGYEPPITNNQDPDEDPDIWIWVSIITMFGILGAGSYLSILKIRKEKTG